MAAVWLGMAVLVTLLGLYAGYRMGLARNDWERHRFEKIEEENRALRRELSVARVKIDGATRLLEVTEAEPLASAAVPTQIEAEPVGDPTPAAAEAVPEAEPTPADAHAAAAAGEAESAAPQPATSEAVLDFRKLTKPVEEVVIDLTEGGARHDASEVAMLEELLNREIDLIVTDAES